MSRLSVESFFTVVFIL